MDTKYSEAESISVNIAQQVAEAEGVDSLELSPLSDAIDTDSLDRLIVGMDSGPGKVVFDHWGYRITVHHTGDIALQKLYKL